MRWRRRVVVPGMMIKYLASHARDQSAHEDDCFLACDLAKPTERFRNAVCTRPNPRSSIQWS